MVKKNVGGLGRGLHALISENTDSVDNNGVEEIKLIDIDPNINQPRKTFNEEKISELVESIRNHGIVQPILVQRVKGRYMIVAGERRWRAAKLAGLKTIPAVIRDFTDQEIMEIGLIENLQREDLNVIEEALAYKKLMEEFNLTQENISQRVGKSRPSIANTLRLLNLNPDVLKLVQDGNITGGHARALLAIEDKDKQLELAWKIVDENLSVRDIENLAKLLLNPAQKPSKQPNKKDIFLIETEETLKRRLGTKVNIIKGKKKGKIEIEYYSLQELERLIELLS